MGRKDAVKDDRPYDGNTRSKSKTKSFVKQKTSELNEENPYDAHSRTSKSRAKSFVKEKSSVDKKNRQKNVDKNDDDAINSVRHANLDESTRSFLPPIKTEGENQRNGTTQSKIQREQSKTNIVAKDNRPDNASRNDSLNTSRRGRQAVSPNKQSRDTNRPVTPKSINEAKDSLRPLSHTQILPQIRDRSDSFRSVLYSREDERASRMIQQKHEQFKKILDKSFKWKQEHLKRRLICSERIQKSLLTRMQQLQKQQEFMAKQHGIRSPLKHHRVQMLQNEALGHSTGPMYENTMLKEDNKQSVGVAAGSDKITESHLISKTNSMGW